METQTESRLKNTHFQGIILLVITAVLWSSGGLLIKWVDWHPLAISGARSLIAALVIRAAFYKSSLTWDAAQWTGAAGYAATVMLFVSATKLTTAANAIVLQYTAPVYVAILGAWFLKEKPSLADWTTIGVVLAGMVLFFMDKMSAGGMAGNLLAVASGVSMALMAVAMRKQKEGSPFGSVFLGNVIAFFCGVPFMLGGLPNISSIIALILLGTLQLGLSYVLYSIAIKRVQVLEATIITMIEPILNPIWVFLLLGEVPGPWSLAGGLIIIAAIAGRYIIPAVAQTKADG